MDQAAAVIGRSILPPPFNRAGTHPSLNIRHFSGLFSDMEMDRVVALERQYSG
ncbi:MAG: hypothetical protein HRU33_04785 [Rhodobacteraceae bacterium]|nr:hypothetical protein [Paracoccaceae bacterium]